MEREPTEGVILAAGFGTRLAPLTREIPKPLLPVAGIPAIEIAAAALFRGGAGTLHINLHHRGDLVREFVERRGWPAVFHEEPEILGTGGGIGAMVGAFAGTGPILLRNADAVTSIGYGGALVFHRDRGALVTMILLPAGRPGHAPPAAVSVDPGGFVTGIGAGSGPGSPAFGYTGLAVIEPAALWHFPRGRPEGLVPVLLRMIAARPGSVAGFDASAAADDVEWGEIGTPASYLDMHRRILVDRSRFDPLIPPPPLPLRVDAGARVDPDTVWRGFLDVGPGAVIERGAELEDCVVLGGSSVGTGVRLRGAVVFPGGVLEAV